MWWCVVGGMYAMGVHVMVVYMWWWCICDGGVYVMVVYM